MRTLHITPGIGKLYACKLSELSKRILRKAGYAIHPTEDPETAWRLAEAWVPQFSGFSDPWELIWDITRCDTLADMIAQGVLDPGKDFWRFPWFVTGHADFFQEACAMPLRDLGKLAGSKFLGFLWNGIFQGLRRSYGLQVTYSPDGKWETHTMGLENYLSYNPDFPFLHAIRQALDAHPEAKTLLAFPVQAGSVIHCKPLGIWLAKPDRGSRQVSFAIQVDCLP